MPAVPPVDPNLYIPLKEHIDTIHELEGRYYEERDRRYTEVALEREKALRIKEEGDSRALNLAREIQTYKDEKANELREQINRERNLYASKDDLVALSATIDTKLEPLVRFINNSAGGTTRSSQIMAAVVAAAVVMGAAMSVIGFIVINN